ncbi:MAG: hypothetical protein K6G47_13620 [Clostridia bacterium]|nr:hypothetical protein [Clostridia bacterium]
MKRKYLKFTSLLLLSSLILSSCQSSKKTDIKVRTKDKVSEETDEPDGTETETTDDTEPRVVTIESNLYSDAEAPIVVDWDNYQKAETKENVFERKSEDYISEFVPSSDYGAVFPYQATYSTVGVAEYEDNSDYHAYESYGLVDSEGRIICDPIFSNAYVSYNGMIFVATGYGEDSKVGFITADGTQFTGVKYDSYGSVYSQDYFYAYGNGKVTIFNPDMSVYLEKSFNVDFSSIDDEQVLEEIESMKEYGYEIEPEDVYVSDVLDNSHLIIEFWGYYFVLDLNTGKLIRTETVCSYSGVLVGSKDGVYYLMDKDGNQISDTYINTVYGSIFPILVDNEGNYCGLDSEGNIVRDLGKHSYLEYLTLGDYMLIKIENNEWTMFDKDFNDIGVFKSSEAVYLSSWSKQDRIGEDLIYVLDDGDIKDPFTGEIIIEDVPDAYNIYIGNECSAAYTSDGMVLSNGKKFSSYEYWDTTADIVTGKEYMTMTDDYSVKIYDVASDEIIEIRVGCYVDSYSVSIADGNVYFYSYYDEATYIYDFTDVDEPQLLFVYYYTNPLGDD